MRWPAIVGVSLCLALSAACGLSGPDSEPEVGSDAVAGVQPETSDRPTDAGGSVTTKGPEARSVSRDDAKPGVDDSGGAAAADNGAGSGDDEAADDPATPVAVVLRVGGVDPEFAETIQSIDGVEWLTSVDSGQLHMVESVDSGGEVVDQTPPGFLIQLEAVGYRSTAALVDLAPGLVDELAGLEADELVLSRSSAELRRLGVGAIIRFDNGASYRVGAVIADSLIGNAEVMLFGSDALAEAGISSPRQLAFVGFDGSGPALEQALLDANGGSGVRVFGGRDNGDRDRGRTTLSSIEVKQIFGEFAFRPNGPSAIEIDPAWTEANLVTVDLPLLGQVKCHRIFAEVLREVMQGLVDDDRADVIDPGAFQGCWNPRRIAGSARISKHSWGMAADINFGNSLDGGPGSPVNQELLDRMTAADVISGHLWTATPDPGHFEYRGP